LRVRHINNQADQQWLDQLTRKVEEVIRAERPRWWLYIVFKLLFFLGGSALCYGLLFKETSIWIFFLTYVLYGWFSFLLTLNFAHDGAHDTISSKRNWNNFIFQFLFSLLGADASAWKDRHLKAHHFAPNVDGYDSDLSVTILFRITPDSPYRNYHRWQFIYAPILYSTYSFFWIFLKDITLFFREDKIKDVRKIVTFWGLKAAYFIVSFGLPFMYAPQSGWIIFAAYMVMHLTQSLFLLFTFLISHHVEKTAYPKISTNETIAVSWVENQVLSSNDIHPFSWLANFIFGGFNNHIAHHLFPGVHHFYYRKMNKVIYKEIHQKGWRVSQTSFFGGIVSHVRLLKELGRASAQKVA
jgi:linoleoyl-CoA desaturase